MMKPVVGIATLIIFAIASLAIGVGTANLLHKQNMLRQRVDRIADAIKEATRHKEGGKVNVK